MIQYKFTTNNVRLVTNTIHQNRRGGFFTALGALVWVLVLLWLFLPRVAHSQDVAWVVRACSGTSGQCRPVLGDAGNIMAFRDLASCERWKSQRPNPGSMYCDMMANDGAGAPWLGQVPGQYRLPMETRCNWIGSTWSCRTN